MQITYENNEGQIEGIFEQRAELVEESPAVKKWKKASGATWKSKLKAIELFQDFLASHEDAEGRPSPDEIIECERVRDDKDGTNELIKKFLRWLMGESVEDYEDRVLRNPGERGGEKYYAVSTAQYFTQGVMRVFFRENDVKLGKTIVLDSGRSAVRKTDEKFSVLEFDDLGRGFMDYSQLKELLDRLTLRDRTIMLICLSSSQDIGEILKLGEPDSLTIGWAKDQWDKERFFWEGKRQKTGCPFMTFLSKEATDMVKSYITSERD